jgi:hypothetical protein
MINQDGHLTKAKMVWLKKIKIKTRMLELRLLSHLVVKIKKLKRLLRNQLRKRVKSWPVKNREIRFLITSKLWIKNKLNKFQNLRKLLRMRRLLTQISLSEQDQKNWLLIKIINIQRKKNGLLNKKVMIIPNTTINQVGPSKKMIRKP